MNAARFDFVLEASAALKALFTFAGQIKFSISLRLREASELAAIRLAVTASLVGTVIIVVAALVNADISVVSDETMWPRTTCTTEPVVKVVLYRYIDLRMSYFCLVKSIKRK